MAGIGYLTSTSHTSTSILSHLLPSHSQLITTMSSGQKAARPVALLSRRQIEGLIAEGKTIIIIDQQVLKVDAWLSYHPGGEKAILHMVGRDATDEVNA